MRMKTLHARMANQSIFGRVDYLHYYLSTVIQIDCAILRVMPVAEKHSCTHSLMKIVHQSFSLTRQTCLPHTTVHTYHSKRSIFYLHQLRNS